MKKTFLVLVSLLLLTVNSGVAQGPEPTLDSLRIAVWPEYDQPAVLVIYEASLSAEAALPRTMRVTLPPKARINAVAYVGEGGGLFNLPWQSEEGEDGQKVSFELEHPSFVIEYYVDVISPPPNRSFELHLQVPYDAQEATLTLRLPSRASDLRTTPELAPVGLDSLGNQQYSQALGSLTAGESVDLSVSYVKADNNPSLEVVVAEQPVASPPAGADVSAWLPWLVGAIIGAVIAGGGALLLYWLRNNRSRVASAPPQDRRRPTRQRSKRREQQPAGGESNRFCPQCGQRYGPNDRFCRVCGTPRR